MAQQVSAAVLDLSCLCAEELKLVKPFGEAEVSGLGFVVSTG